MLEVWTLAGGVRQPRFDDSSKLSRLGAFWGACLPPPAAADSAAPGVPAGGRRVKPPSPHSPPVSEARRPSLSIWPMPSARWSGRITYGKRSATRHVGEETGAQLDVRVRGEYAHCRATRSGRGRADGRHDGPPGTDGAGAWASDSVALAHRRLKVIDLSRGRRPADDRSALGLTSSSTAASTTTASCGPSSR